MINERRYHPWFERIRKLRNTKNEFNKGASICPKCFGVTIQTGGNYYEEVFVCHRCKIKVTEVLDE